MAALPAPAPSVFIATRGSALALAQAQTVLEQARHACPQFGFEIKVIKTTGDKLEAASLVNANLPKGLFTKELEHALLDGEADLAVHSLKDLPTDLPAGLTLGAVLRRADVRDVLLQRSAVPATHPTPGAPASLAASFASLPEGTTVATSSTRRQAQLHEHRPDLKVVPIRGNVPTRLRKLAEQSEIQAIVLAAAGLERLHLHLDEAGSLVQKTVRALEGNPVPAGLHGLFLPVDAMLPCVGQAAIGLEIRLGDKRLEQICGQLNDGVTAKCVAAERSFLRAMGGGCQLAVAAYAVMDGSGLHLQGVSYLGGQPVRGRVHGLPDQAEDLGEQLASLLR